MKRNPHRIVILGRHNQVEIPPPPISPTPEEVERARLDAESARAETARLKRELEEARKNSPTDEQRARWAELEQKAQADEEKRLREAGEFEGWRQQVTERHARDVQELNVQKENEVKRARALEDELRDTLISREFADATDLFGPSAKTVLMPSIARDHFGRYVDVITDPGVDGKPVRTVIVKDMHGTTIMDPKTGKPLPFAKAMNELIDAHPQKAYILRGSGRVGANNSGGNFDGEHGIDTSRLKPKDFERQDVRDAVRNKMSNSGGLQIGPGFDALKRRQRGQ